MAEAIPQGVTLAYLFLISLSPHPVKENFFSFVFIHTELSLQVSACVKHVSHTFRL
jgi:hypothetical protein